MKKRILAAILSAVLVVTGANVTAFAAETEEPVIEAEVEGEVYTAEEDVPCEMLYEGYVESLLYPEQSATWTIRNKLKGNNLAVYNKLKECISQTARGERASTVYEISLEELGITKSSWTKEELGVDAIVANRQITNEAKEAVREQLGIQISIIMDVLLADCPYELYWFDKTVGVSGPAYYMSATSNEIWITTDFTFKFYVASDYAAGSLELDTSEINRVSAAIANAKEIVADYKNKSDYEKLDGYRKEICNLVSYNNMAANGYYSYGDPWQIVHVFDGNSNTNVVCEGYSKAFQYLCDLSEFKNSKVNCVSVSGIMYGVSSTGPHMWNIVTMDDGRNYLVDVTNCDAGMIGAEKQLFLAPCVSGNTSIGYTFQCQGGSIRYTYEADMFDIYDTSELAISSEAYVESECSRGNHDWNEAEVIEPTCTEPGEKRRSCKNCEETEVLEVYDATGHSFGNGEEVFECLGCGILHYAPKLKVEDQTVLINSEYDLLKAASAMDAEDGDLTDEIQVDERDFDISKRGTYTVVYSVTDSDGKTVTASATITVIDPRVTGIAFEMEKVSLACDQEPMKLAVNVEVQDDAEYELEWDSSDESIATVDDSGIVTIHSAGTVVITAKATEELQALCTLEISHNEVADEDKAPDCVTEGHTKGSHCSDCGKVLKAPEVIPAKGHTMKKTEAVAAGCDTDGNIEYYTCVICKKLYADEKGSEELDAKDIITAKTGHEFKWTVDKEPTEEEYGYKHEECIRCHHVRNENTLIDKVESEPINPFVDVKDTDYFYTPVMWAVANGVTSGMSPTTFAPGSACTRAQVVSFLWRAAGKPVPEMSASPFADVKPGAYYYDAVLWAVENGITSGVSVTSFAPDSVCTRGQIVSFLHRYAGKPAPESSVMQFADVKAGAYYYDAVLWAVESKVTSGMSATSFAPDAVCTRGQVVSFLHRYMED